MCLILFVRAQLRCEEHEASENDTVGFEPTVLRYGVRRVSNYSTANCGFILLSVTELGSSINILS